MIERENNKDIFLITKEHTIKYYEHTYYIKNIKLDNILNKNVSKEEWSHSKIRYILFKLYFKDNKEAKEIGCKNFFKALLGDIFNDTDNIYAEIKKSRISVIQTNNAFNNIIFKLQNIKDKDNNKIVYTYEYKHYNKIKKKKKY